MGLAAVKTNIAQGACSGCHACYTVCPRRAITMTWDDEGFLYPQINDKLCVECSLCRVVCPANGGHPPASQPEKAYAAVNNDDCVRANSSSGGVFSLLAKETIASGGVVYGAAFDQTFRVTHQRTEEDATAMQTSKYVQSCVGDAFARVEQDLVERRAVLFTGTPCQVAGLHRYLQIKHVDMQKLCLVDLICHGVPSPLVWEQYLEYMAGGKMVTSVNFRDKSHSWSKFSLAISFSDGSQYRALAGDDAYMKGFFANLTLRPSCYACAQKTTDRMSDLTIADCWGIDNFLPELNDGKGTSAIIVHSPKGEALLRSVCGNMQVKEVPVEQVLRYNRAMEVSVSAHPRRNVFFCLLREGTGVTDAIERVLRPTPKDRAKAFVVAAKRLGKKVLKQKDRFHGRRGPACE